MQTKTYSRTRRKQRIRKKVTGTQQRPRLSVFRSAVHIYAQVVDDSTGQTLVAVSTLNKDVRDKVSEENKTNAAKLIGGAVASACLSKGIAQVVFDRNGFTYHGRIKALADAAREGGLRF